MTRVSDEQHHKCEACGLQATAEYIRVRTTNGGLLLCVQCLGDINRKNPEVQSLRQQLTARLNKWREQASFYEKKQVESKTKRDAEYWQVCKVLTLDQADEIDAILKGTK